MDNDERKLLDGLLTLARDTNDRIAKFTKYILVLLVTIIISFSIMTMYIVSSYNSAIKECTRIYFETPYELQGITNEISQDVKVGAEQ